MKVTQLATYAFASLAAAFAAAVPSRSVGETPTPPRAEAAKILDEALGETARSRIPADQRWAVATNACRRAMEVLGRDSRAAAALQTAIKQAEALPEDDAKARLKVLGDWMREVHDDLAFRPIVEAAMPKGFPPLTPPNEVEIKDYPAYRKAQATGGENGAFWTLFMHIKSNRIPMTAPVEMDYAGNASQKRGRAGEPTMSFLYGEPDAGKPGRQGRVEVLDVPAAKVVSTGVRGPRTTEAIEAARERLEDWLADQQDRYVAIGQMRVLGYNSPFVARERNFFEVQIPVKAAK